MHFDQHKSILAPSTKIDIDDSIGKDTSLIYIPRDINLDNPAEGLPLKEGVGYLSIREEIDNHGNRLSYLYRFTSDEYIYIAEKKNLTTDDWMKDSFFNFHYQEDDKHKWPHVSFLHPSIKYISRSISLEEFLEFIEYTFFTKGTRKNSFPWHSRF